MITFVDTNVLLDVFSPDPKWGRQSKRTLEKAFQQGSLIINHIIYAELAPQFINKNRLDEVLQTLGVQIIDLNSDTAFQAGMAWKRYRHAGGKRNRVLSDFFIGAHALSIADQLLTRDRGFYRNYFNDLNIVY